MNICVFIPFIVILCITLMDGCATDPMATDQAEMDTKIALITDHGPAYPPNMEKLGRTGFVSLDCTITRDGQASDCSIIKATSTEFADAARTYVAGARYRPATRDGVPVTVVHHVININFSIEFKPQKIDYVCLITPAGQARNCHGEISGPAIPPSVENILLRKLDSLPVVPNNKEGRAIEDPHRMIEALLIFQERPGSDFSTPSLPAQTQLNLLLDCGMGNPLQCREVSKLPFSTELQSYEDDRFVALSIGFNGIFPVRDEKKP